MMGSGILKRLDLAPAPLLATGVILAFTLALLVVLRLGLPVWSLLLVVSAVTYVILVLQYPTIGLIMVVGVFFLPLQIFGRVTLLQTVGVVTASLLLVGFLALRRRLFVGNVLFPLFMLGVLILVSFWYTPDAARTTFYFRKWILNMVFALLLINMVTEFGTFKKIIWTIMVMASVNSVVAMFDFAASTDFNYRSVGLLENANRLGHLAVLAFPLAIYQYLYRSGPLRWVGLALCGLLVGGVVTSVSRGATLSLVLVLGAIIVLERRRILPLTLVIVLMVCALPFLPDYFGERVGNLATDVKRSVLLEERQDLTSRGYLNSAGIRIWLNHPVLGVGIGNFGYYFVEKEFNPGFQGTDRIVAHNIYLQALAETGIVGTMVFVWLLLLTTRNIVRARRSSQGVPERWVYLRATEMMALAILISISSSGNLMNNDFWMLITLTAVSSRLTVERPASAPRELPAAEPA